MARKKPYLKVTVQKVTPGRRRPDWSTSYIITPKHTAIYGAKDRRTDIEKLLGFGTRLLPPSKDPDE
jgi:hypothetical protein